MLYKYCANIVEILCKHYIILQKFCANILPIFCKFFANIFQIMYIYCTNILQILCKYCTNIGKYCANIVQILFKQGQISCTYSKNIVRRFHNCRDSASQRIPIKVSQLVSELVTFCALSRVASQLKNSKKSDIVTLALAPFPPQPKSDIFRE